MWIYTEHGFVSAVAKNKNSTELTVRARDRRSLDGLVALGSTPVTIGEGTDYPYRTLVSRAVFKYWVDQSIEDLGYSNFKNRIYETRGSEYAHTLGAVWDANLDLEDQEAAEYWRDLSVSKLGR
jgi:hypothetical protein